MTGNNPFTVLWGAMGFIFFTWFIWPVWSPFSVYVLAAVFPRLALVVAIVAATQIGAFWTAQGCHGKLCGPDGRH